MTTPPTTTTTTTEAKTCAQCGVELSGRRLRYCSLTCREAYYNAQVKVSLLPAERYCRHCSKQLAGRATAWCNLSCKSQFQTELTLQNDIAVLARKCGKCGLTKPLASDFYKAPTGTYRRTCKACVMAGNTARSAQPDAAYKQRQYHLKGLYGITPEQYEELLQAQGGTCAICSKPPTKMRLSIDHDHLEGHIRGLLCTYCNLRVIGKTRDADLYRRAADYLDNPPAKRVLPEDHRVPVKKPKARRKRAKRKPAKAVSTRTR